MNKAIQNQKVDVHKIETPKLPCGKFCGYNCSQGCDYWYPNRKDSNGRGYCSWYDTYYYPYERQGCLSHSRLK